MKYIETDFNLITILDDKTVLLEAKENVEINLEKAQHTNRLIQDEMSGDYGLIISRKADYSIVPHEKYSVLNNLENLKAIALIACERNFLPVDMEKRFYKNKLEAFKTIQEAHKWITGLLEK